MSQDAQSSEVERYFVDVEAEELRLLHRCLNWPGIPSKHEDEYLASLRAEVESEVEYESASCTLSLSLLQLFAAERVLSDIVTALDDYDSRHHVVSQAEQESGDGTTLYDRPSYSSKIRRLLRFLQLQRRLAYLEERLEGFDRDREIQNDIQDKDFTSIEETTSSLQASLFDLQWERIPSLEERLEERLREMESQHAQVLLSINSRLSTVEKLTKILHTASGIALFFSWIPLGMGWQGVPYFLLVAVGGWLVFDATKTSQTAGPAFHEYHGPGPDPQGFA